MPRRAGPLAAALLAIACGGAGGDGPARDAAAPAAEPATPGTAPLQSAERGAGRRGDRHARAAARRPRTVKTVEGAVSQASDRLVVVRSPGRPPLALRVGPGTTVTVEGRPARAGALREGAPVRAAYRTGADGRPTALSIEARAAGAAPVGEAPRGGT